MKLKDLGVLVLAYCLVPSSAALAEEPAFTLPPLPYAANALEPYLDQMTMEIHHGKHHQAYVSNLNAQVKDHPQLSGLTLEQIMGRISTFNAAVRNNGGGHYNHGLFWTLMAPAGTGGRPSRALLAAVQRDLGSWEGMQEQFERAALGRFGSGWAWLILTPEKKLAVTSTPNQDNPLMDIAEQRGTPILAVDVWEHAYYLSYQNRRWD